jgi:hypothetical protein
MQFTPEMQKAHILWLRGDIIGIRADLRSANLRSANLRSANLTGANLTGADLTGANLTGADLTGADLTGADLTGANLWCANLTGADLTSADLTSANLPGAPHILLANWGSTSDELCGELMRYDAANHPKPEMFDIWSAGGKCPMIVGWERAANFTEKRDSWKPGPALPALELVMRLFQEKGITR